MEFSELPIFFKRRFDEKIFKQALFRNMEFWVTESRVNFREFETNVINETVFGYFASQHQVEIYNGEIPISDVYEFEDFVSTRYGNLMREYWIQNR